MSEDKVNISTILDPSYVECHDIITSYLDNDLYTLYSCILVNRSFCRIFIPTLWKNPFKFVKDKDELLAKMFNTLIHCLDISDKNYLITAKSININDLPTASNAYFKYHTLIKEFELNPLQKGMKLWTSEYLSTFAHQDRPSKRRVHDRMIKLNDYIGKLLFSQGNQYNSINIFHNDLSRPNFLFNICQFDNYEESLAKVNKLALGFYSRNINTNLIPKITKNFLTLQNALSPNIQHLQCSFDTTGSYSKLLKNLIDFIRTQQHLKSLSIQNGEFYHHVNSFLDALKNQSKSLTFLKLRPQQFTPLVPILESLPNLIVFDFEFLINKFDANMSQGISPLPVSLFKNLEHLYYVSYRDPSNLSNPSNPPNTLQLLFKEILLNSNLKSLKVDNGYHRFIREVQQEIPLNLTHFHLTISTSSYSSLNVCDILKDLYHLVHLKLSDLPKPGLTFTCETLEDSFEFSQSLPNSLKIFEISLNISDEYLRNLLNVSKCNFQCIKLHNVNLSMFKKLEIFIDYSKSKNCFKELGLNRKPSLHHFFKNSIKEKIEKAKNHFNITTNNSIDEPFYSRSNNNNDYYLGNINYF